jgi:hypothetical protein
MSFRSQVAAIFPALFHMQLCLCARVCCSRLQLHRLERRNITSERLRQAFLFLQFQIRVFNRDCRSLRRL